MNDSAKPNSPVPIETHHSLDDFDCGVPALNKYLKSYALQNHRAGGARTYITTRENKVVGYYSLAYGSVSVDEAPPRVREGLGRYPVPVMVLARLAVDLGEKGKGLGAGLLRDALARTIQAADIAGLRALLVHAKDERAKAFYQRFGFTPYPVDEFHLYLLMKDLKKTMRELK
ncbi:MAG: GNAT family N-acetyltransferase [Candidatus Omnitrophota bacterium]|jgi:GNAT superfamily N-acetyltransferase|nr:MAG: GNAT family N-acetyltransferase [Candidatus Omnitrophota bacterium]